MFFLIRHVFYLPYGFYFTYYKSNFYLLFFYLGFKKFSPVTTFFPVLDSNSFRAFLAMAPPFLLALAFWATPFAC